MVESACVTGKYARVSLGYGWVRGRDGGWVPAYRMAWVDANGPIPAGYHIHHKCKNRACINPDHLECLSPEEHQSIHGKESRRLSAPVTREEVRKRAHERYIEKRDNYKCSRSYELSSKRVSHRVEPLIPAIGPCVEWDGFYCPDGTPWSKNPKTGLRGRSAHRIVWEKHHNASLLKSAVIFKLCRNKACVNPDHLLAMSKFSANFHTGCIFTENLKKTHCKHGHPLSGGNLSKRKHQGRFRICKMCGTIRRREDRKLMREIKGTIRYLVFLRSFWWFEGASRYFNAFVFPVGSIQTRS